MLTSPTGVSSLVLLCATSGRRNDLRVWRPSLLSWLLAFLVFLSVRIERGKMACATTPCLSKSITSSCNKRSAEQRAQQGASQRARIRCSESSVIFATDWVDGAHLDCSGLCLTSSQFFPRPMHFSIFARFKCNLKTEKTSSR